MYKVILHKDAAKFYMNVERKLQQRIAAAIKSISENPRYHVHIRRLEGELKQMYRYRLGNLRILYEIHEDMRIVRIKTIEFRGSAYK